MPEQAPTTRYARSGDTHIAYQVFGEGRVRPVLVPRAGLERRGLPENQPLSARFPRRASFSAAHPLRQAGDRPSDRISRSSRWINGWTTCAPSWTLRAPSGRHCSGPPRGALRAVRRDLPATNHRPGHPGVVRLAVAGAGSSLGPPRRGVGHAHLDPRTALGGPAMARARPNLWAPTTQRLQHAGGPIAPSFAQAASPAAAVSILDGARDRASGRSCRRSGCRPSILHRTGDRAVSLERARFLADGSDGAKLVELPAPTTISAWLATEETLDRRDRAAADRRPPRPRRRIGCWRRVDVYRHRRLDRARRFGSATAGGATSWRATTRRCAANSTRFRGRRSTPPATASWRSFDGPARAVRCAPAIVGAVRAARHRGPGGSAHRRDRADGRDVGGIAVHIGARVAGQAGRRGLGLEHRQGPRRRAGPSSSRVAPTSCAAFRASGDSSWLPASRPPRPLRPQRFGAAIPSNTCLAALTTSSGKLTPWISPRRVDRQHTGRLELIGRSLAVRWPERIMAAICPLSYPTCS